MSKSWIRLPNTGVKLRKRRLKTIKLTPVYPSHNSSHRFGNCPRRWWWMRVTDAASWQASCLITHGAHTQSSSLPARLPSHVRLQTFSCRQSRWRCLMLELRPVSRKTWLTQCASSTPRLPMMSYWRCWWIVTSSKNSRKNGKRLHIERPRIKTDLLITSAIWISMGIITQIITLP